MATGAPPSPKRRPGWVFGLAALLLWLLWMLGGLLAPRLAQAMQGHETLAAWLFLASSALAVVLPLLSNLPLVPAAVQLWGPGWTAAALLAGWTLGSWLAFVLGRLVRHGWLQHAPGLRQATDVDRWIHPRHPVASLVLLRVAFPIDVLSFALGVFSAQTTVARLLVSTLVGAAPFAVLFAWLPQLRRTWQLALLLAGALVFAGYAAWIGRLKRRPEALALPRPPD